MEDDSKKTEKLEVNEKCIENSGLIGELIEKISENGEEAITTLALTLGRICNINDMPLDQLYDILNVGYEMQNEINEYIEEHEEEHKHEDEEDNKEDDGKFGAN